MIDNDRFQPVPPMSALTARHPTGRELRANVRRPALRAVQLPFEPTPRATPAAAAHS